MRELKESLKWGFSDFSEKIINSNIYDFLVEQESVNGLLTFCKKQNVFEKSGSWVMIRKSQGQSEYRILSTTNKLRCEFEFLGVSRGP